MMCMNNVRDAVYLDLETGVCSWVMPKLVPIAAVRYMTHFPEGTPRPYYENLRTKAVTWEFPQETDI